MDRNRLLLAFVLMMMVAIAPSIIWPPKKSDRRTVGRRYRPHHLGDVPALPPRLQYAWGPAQGRRTPPIPVVCSRRFGAACAARARGRRILAPSPGPAERRYRLTRQLGLPAESRRSGACRA